MNIVAHNMLAMNANRQFNIINKNKAKSTEKLSSGYRINRAADDAAGLSISEKMRRQIRGLSQGIDNTEDGISLCQVADGALAEVTEMLHRITELSVQSANGTYTDEDRKAIQQEISQIQQEIERIGDTTKFNELKIFSGQIKKTNIPATYQPKTADNFNVIGTPNDTTSTFYTISANYSGFSINADSFYWSDFKDDNGNDLSANPKVAGTYSMNYHGLTLSLDVQNNADMRDIIGTLDKSTFSTKVTAGQMVDRVSMNSVSGKILNVEGDTSNKKFTLEFSGNNITVVTGLTKVGNTSVPENITSFWGDVGQPRIFVGSNDNTIIPAGDYEFVMGNEANLGPDRNKGNQLIFSFTLAEDVTRKELEDLLNGAEISHDSFSDTVVTGKQSGSSYPFKTIWSTDEPQMYVTRDLLTDLGYEKNSGIINASFIEDTNGDIALELDNGYKYHLASVTNIDFSVNKKYLFANTDSGVTNTITICGVLKDDWKDLVQNTCGVEFEYNAPTSGVHREYYTGISMKNSGQISIGGGSSLETFNPADYKGIKIKDGETIEKEGELSLWIQSGCEAGQGMFLEVDRMNTTILGINDLDVSTASGANHALETIQGALEKVSVNRSKIGAQQNRLEHTIANEQNVLENTTSAESLIRDTDMAKEMVEFSKGMILENVGQAMLAQANKSNQNVLSLLS